MSSSVYACMYFVDVRMYVYIYIYLCGNVWKYVYTGTSGLENCCVAQHITHSLLSEINASVHCFASLPSERMAAMRTYFCDSVSVYIIRRFPRSLADFMSCCWMLHVSGHIVVGRQPTHGEEDAGP